MAAPCSVCSHPDRTAIDAELSQGGSAVKCAKTFGLNRHAINRHRTAHLGIVSERAKGFAIVNAHQMVAASIAGNDLLNEMRTLQREAERYRAIAESEGSVKTALLALDRTTKLLELQSRLVLESAQGRASDVSSNPVWKELAALIMRSLEPYPEATKAVIAAIESKLGR